MASCLNFCFSSPRSNTFLSSRCEKKHSCCQGVSIASLGAKVKDHRPSLRALSLQSTPENNITARKVPSMNTEVQRRALLASSVSFFSFFSMVELSPMSAAEEVEQQNPLIQKLLQRSRENKEKYDQERLAAYYRKNYGDYFKFIEGTLLAKRSEELTENDKKILEWLKENK
eukprot:TRINITY_DN1415_c0_g1_i1.p1 TRINITY_DN1415_c0_g1~~TRINITY_DN1415_c0_g1_i1.p1  ORF type:complete len:172 (+),score=31.75 TRINITY_DN1415_c0_g1_i1:90-605(+)